jgi:hypothetical protein
MSRVMSLDEKREFIQDHLYHELCCLLEATTVWQIYKNNQAGCDVSVAMDSAFIHARNLFVFFAPTKNDSKNDNSVKVTEFGPKSTYKSGIYSTWKVALNRHLFHLDVDRFKPTNQKNSGALQDKVKIFADEILRLWRLFENDPEAEKVKITVYCARLRAVEDARNTANERIVSLF